MGSQIKILHSESWYFLCFSEFHASSYLVWWTRIQTWTVYLSTNQYNEQSIIVAYMKGFFRGLLGRPIISKTTQLQSLIKHENSWYLTISCAVAYERILRLFVQFSAPATEIITLYVNKLCNLADRMTTLLVITRHACETGKWEAYYRKRNKLFLFSSGRRRLSSELMFKLIIFLKNVYG